jgi:hypothetical protein
VVDYLRGNTGSVQQIVTVGQPSRRDSPVENQSLSVRAATAVHCKVKT